MHGNLCDEGGITKLYIVELVKTAYRFVQKSNKECDLVDFSVYSMKENVTGCDN